MRNILIPKMEKDVNSSAVAHLCRAAIEFAKADDYIQNRTDDAFKQIVKGNKNNLLIDLKTFRDCDEAIKANIILRSLEKLTPHRKDITSAHVDSILALSCDSFGSASVDLPYGLIANRSYDELTIGKKDTKNSPDSAKEVEIPRDLDVGDKISFEIPNLGVAHISILQYNGGKLFPSSAYTKWFDYDRIQGAVFRCRRPDDYILLEQEDGLHKKKISKLMTDEKVPQSKRDEIYLLTDGSNVLWVPGVRMSGAYKISDTTGRILAINIE